MAPAACNSAIFVESAEATFFFFRSGGNPKISPAEKEKTGPFARPGSQTISGFFDRNAGSGAGCRTMGLFQDKDGSLNAKLMKTMICKQTLVKSNLANQT